MEIFLQILGFKGNLFKHMSIIKMVTINDLNLPIISKILSSELLIALYGLLVVLSCLYLSISDVIHFGLFVSLVSLCEA